MAAILQNCRHLFCNQLFLLLALLIYNSRPLLKMVAGRVIMDDCYSWILFLHYAALDFSTIVHVCDI